MKNELEHRRFRTWESDAAFDPSRSWKIVAKYGWIRMRSTWYILAILIIAALASIIGLGISAITQTGSGLDYWGIVAQTQIALGFAGVFLLFVGSPLFSEDTRFNAPLFYYSKPLSAWDYYRAKMGMMFGFAVLLGVVPAVILIVMLLIVPSAGMPDYYADWCSYGGRDSADCIAERQYEWDVRHVNTLGDGLYLLVTVIPGALVSIAFIGSIFAVMSAYVDRAWHAAMGALIFIVGLSTIGGLALSGVNSAMFHVGGPVQWLGAVTQLPLELRFSVGANPYDGVMDPWYREQYHNAGLAIAISYTMMILITVICARLTLNRLAKLEEAA